MFIDFRLDTASGLMLRNILLIIYQEEKRTVPNCLSTLIKHNLLSQTLEILKDVLGYLWTFTHSKHLFSLNIINAWIYCTLTALDLNEVLAV